MLILCKYCYLHSQENAQVECLENTSIQPRLCIEGSLLYDALSRSGGKLQNRHAAIYLGSKCIICVGNYILWFFTGYHTLTCTITASIAPSSPYAPIFKEHLLVFIYTAFHTFRQVEEYSIPQQKVCITFCTYLLTLIFYRPYYLLFSD